jgi:pimeloyl-ACP methyl ester carboxylesterase
MLGPVFSLRGDSFANDTYFHEPLRPRLAAAFSEWIDQREILNRTGETSFSMDIGRRLALLEQLVPAGEDARRVVLIGRSSGARVATLFAMKHPVAAVICQAYPFRAARRVIEPERFAHLAEIKAPTLIVQGRADQFGGMDLTENYALSPSVTVKFVEGGHDFGLSPEGWDELASSIIQFCDGAVRGMPPEPMPFDEAFYLQLHTDVAAAVAAGRFVSGEEHFLKHGRQQRRRFRLLAQTIR